MIDSKQVVMILEAEIRQAAREAKRLAAAASDAAKTTEEAWGAWSRAEARQLGVEYEAEEAEERHIALRAALEVYQMVNGFHGRPDAP